MNALERLERANPVPDEDRLLAAPGAMDAFVSSVKQRSGIVKDIQRKTSGVKDRPPIEVPTGSGLADTVAVEGSRKRFGLVAIAAAVVVLVIGAAAAILTLSGDGGNDVVTPSPTTTAAVEALQSGPITSFEDIAGTYQRQGPRGPGYFQFFEDGTWHRSQNRDLVEDRPEDISETRFEGTKVFLTETQGRCDADPDAIYEIHLLESGNLQVVAIEDGCAARSSVYPAEWAPVP